MADYTIVRANRDNIHLVVPLWKVAFGLDVTPDFLRSKYTTRFTKNGQFYGFIVLDDKGVAVAHHTAIPFLIRFGDQNVLAAHSCDSMTAPEAQGKGLFGKIGKLTDELLKSEGFEFIYGFSNENSLPAASRKLGWQPLEQVQGFRIPVRTLPLEKVCRRLRFLHTLYLRLADAAFRKWATTEAVPSSCTDATHGGILRDDDFYAYKTFTFNRRIKVGNVRVWFKLHGQLCIGEMDAAEDAQLEKALVALRRKCFWLGITEMIFQTSPGTPLHSFFIKRYPPFESWVPLYNPFHTSMDVSTLRLTFGDLDSF